eukprot:scaffold3517_cov110-Isochrysis_galbana.AAC.4
MRRNRCTEPLAVRLQVGCLGWLSRARFKAVPVLKAHSTVYGWLIGSRMGASSVGLKRAGSADPVEEMAAGAFARLGTSGRDAGRETPERKGVGWLTARAGRPGLDVPECHWMPERWVLGRASHRAAIGGRELVSGATHRRVYFRCDAGSEQRDGASGPSGCLETGTRLKATNTNAA